MNKKLIFLDIDGTLTMPGSNIPPDSAIEAIQKARANGHKVFLCTGRNYDMLSPLLKYDFDGVIGSAGGYVAYHDETIFDCPMTEQQRINALEVFENNGIFRTIECFDGSFTDEGFENLLKGNSEGNSEFLRWRKQIEESLNIRPMREYKGQPVYKIVFMCNSFKQLEEPKKLLGEDFQFMVQDINEHGIINGELVNKKFDKGQAIKRVAEYLGYIIEDTIGFGDSRNDLEMFEAVRCAVCMGNGDSHIKKYADVICPSVEEDGIKQAFSDLGLV